jgi:hypothetical protein
MNIVEGGADFTTVGHSPESRGSGHLGVSVVICAYTWDRWQQTCAAVKSVIEQNPGPSQVLLVVDHNADLAARARCELRGVTVLENDDIRGLSGARNTGLRAASCAITAFLDDDAVARPGWLASLVEPYRNPDVVATGGCIHPRWPIGRPRWLPPEFDWVVGCSYNGLPDSVAAIRNPIGANMSLRTSLALGVGGFDSAVGRTASRPRGCEETELAIRLTASQPGSAVLYVPNAAVDHHIGHDRVSFSYFMRRCWHEGLSKAAVVRLAGASVGLERERRQVVTIIPAAFLRELRGLSHGDWNTPARMAATLVGLFTAIVGYAAGHIGSSLSQRPLGNANQVRVDPPGR